MRSLPEWKGKDDDARIPIRIRVRVFARSLGRCSGCERRILVGDAWECDHIVALVNGGLNQESNLQVLCGPCHKQKTAADSATKSKTYRMRKRHLGLKKSKWRPMPGTRASGLKRKMDGTWEKRRIPRS